MNSILFLPEQLKPSPTVNGGWHVQVKFPLSKPSLMHTALGSQGVDIHGSGTVRHFITRDSVIKSKFLPEQLKPSPSVNGA